MRVQDKLLRVASALLLAGAFVVVSAERADAGLILYVCNDAACAGGDDDVTMDGDGDGVVGFLNAGLTVDVAFSYPSFGTAGTPFLSMTYGITSDGFTHYGPQPYIYAAQDGFLASPGTAFLDANSTNSGGTAFGFTGAGTFDPAGPAADFDCTTNFLNCGGTFPVGAAPYYLAVGVAPDAPGTGDVTVTVVPDGGSTAALLGTVLMGFGMLRRRFGKA